MKQKQKPTLATGNQCVFAVGVSCSTGRPRLDLPAPPADGESSSPPVRPCEWSSSRHERLPPQLADHRRRGNLKASATSPSANPIPISKEQNVRVNEQDRVKAQWETAIASKHAERPRLNMVQVIAAVTRENPELHRRFVAVANADR